MTKGQDVFGRAVTLTFGSSGDYHQTLLGGILSILIKLSMMTFLGIRMHKMVTYSDNQVLMSFDSAELN